MADVRAARQADRRAETFARLELCAATGERCPTASDGMKTADVSALAYAGEISVEISTHNWRRVTILVGPHAGKSTASNPLKKHCVYMTLDKSGRRGSGGRIMDSGSSGRQQPSKPQLLPYSGRPR